MFKKIAKSFRYVKSVIREKIKAKKRSSKWDEVRDVYLAGHDTCAACGSEKKLQVHHIAPFRSYPELELEEENLITLCMDEECHLLLGHGGSFRHYNPNIKEDSRSYLTADKKKRKILLEAAKKNRKQD